MEPLYISIQHTRARGWTMRRRGPGAEVPRASIWPSETKAATASVVVRHRRAEWPLLDYAPSQSNSSMHRYECVALCKDTSLKRGRFCARSLASCIPRSSEDSVLHPSCARSPRWPPAILWRTRRFEDGLASICVFIHSCKMPCPKKVRRRDLTIDESGGWLVMRRM